MPMRLIRKLSLNIKIVTLVMLVLALGLLMAGALTYWQMKAASYERAGEALMKLAGSTAMAVENLRGDKVAGSGSAADLVKRVYADNREYNQRLEDVWLYRVDSSTWLALPVACWGSSQGNCRQRSITRIMQRALQEGRPVTWREGGVGSRRLAACAPVSMADGSQWLLVLEIDLAVIDEQMQHGLDRIAVAGLLALMVGMAGAWWVTQRITRPMQNFAEVMHLMRSTGDYTIKIDLHPEDREMGVIEENFQRLITSVRDSRRKLEKSYMATLKALVLALDIRDNETAGHSLRVQRIAVTVAEAMKLPTAMRLQVEVGALLHDIGKLGVPDAILRKTSRLEHHEWLEMKKHPELGRRMVEDIEFLQPALEVVYCHHEHFDGRGYPQGLKGDGIPLAARIFAVADAFDSLTSDRVYRRATGFTEARAEIKACSGTHFDPKVVQAFLTIPDAVFARIRREAIKEASERS